MKLLLILCLTLSLLLLSGCGPHITIGPTTEIKTVKVKQYDSQGRPVIIGTVDENKSIRVRYQTRDGGEFVEKLDIGGFNVSPPALPDPPKPTE